MTSANSEVQVAALLYKPRIAVYMSSHNTLLPASLQADLHFLCKSLPAEADSLTVTVLCHMVLVAQSYIVQHRKASCNEHMVCAVNMWWVQQDAVGPQARGLSVVKLNSLA